MPTLEEALKEAEDNKNYDKEWEKTNGPIKYSVEEDIWYDFHHYFHESWMNIVLYQYRNKRIDEIKMSKK